MQIQKTHSLKDAIEMIKADVLLQLSTKEKDLIYAPALLGPPGIGKSQSVLNNIGPQFDQVVLYSMGIIDSDLEFIGLPKIVQLSYDNFETRWIVPDRLNFDKSKTTLIIFDDFHLVEDNQQAIIMQLLTNNRTIHTHRLGDKTAIVFIGNRMQDNSGSAGFYKSIISRLHKIELEPDKSILAKEWLEYASHNLWVTKDNKVFHIHPIMIKLIQSNPDFIYNFDPDIDEFKPYTSPRTLEYLSRLIYVYEGKVIDKFSDKEFLLRHFQEIAGGLVGEKTAYELYLLYDLYSELDIDNLFKVSMSEFKHIIEGDYISKKDDQALLSIFFFVVREIIDRISIMSLPIIKEFIDIINLNPHNYYPSFDVKCRLMHSYIIQKFLGLNEDDNINLSDFLKYINPLKSAFKPKLFEFTMTSSPIVILSLYDQNIGYKEILTDKFIEARNFIMDIFKDSNYKEKVNEFLENVEIVNRYAEMVNAIIDLYNKHKHFFLTSMINALIYDSVYSLFSRFENIKIFELKDSCLLMSTYFYQLLLLLEGVDNG